MPLEDRLRMLGDVLDVDDADLVDCVLARLDEPVRRPVGGAPSVGRLLRVAAVVVVVVAATVAAVPTSRRAVADWFGFDGVRIERRPELDPPDTADPLDRGAVGTIESIGDTEVLVSEFVGTLDSPAISKVATGETNVRLVDVAGGIAIWIDGEPHEVGFMDERGAIVFEGFAGNTLLWQDGPTIRRVEGFETASDAIAYAESWTD